MKTVIDLKLGDPLYTLIGDEIVTTEVSTLESVKNNKALTKVNGILCNKKVTSIGNGAPMIYLNIEECNERVLYNLTKRKLYLETQLIEKQNLLKETIKKIAEHTDQSVIMKQEYVVCTAI